ncbi:26S proteasome non-ATPase regulatory subunit 9-like protein [Obelidium mucronatum]|nr:26S proteasome non-ATPase regulatory subunit 9-like protein [Obelidium mucronatum]
MTEPLVDAQGFPRSDIDVYAVRHLRSQIARRQNDHVALMARVEAALHAVFSAQATATAKAAPDTRRTIAVVASVARGSPADAAGLAPGDAVLSFGGAADLRAVAGVVRRGEPLAVDVRRGAERVALTLVPQDWDGRGLLGCHLVPPTE